MQNVIVLGLNVVVPAEVVSSLKLLNIDVRVAMNGYAPKLKTLQRIRMGLKDIDSNTRS